MKILIISDTHDNLENIEKTLEFIKKEKIKTIIHCGDVCKSSTLELLLKDFKGNIFLTFGNAEIDKEEMLKISHRFKNLKIIEPQKEGIKIGNLKINLSHFPPSKKQKFNYDFFFYGHIHKPWIEKIGNCILANPGNLTGLIYPPTFAILDIKTKELKLQKLY